MLMRLRVEQAHTMSGCSGGQDEGFWGGISGLTALKDLYIAEDAGWKSCALAFILMHNDDMAN